MTGSDTLNDVDGVANELANYRKELRHRLQPALEQTIFDARRHYGLADHAEDLSPEFLALFGVILEQEARIQELQDEISQVNN